jgi:two-component system, NtrC family, sensor kinase
MSATIPHDPQLHADVLHAQKLESIGQLAAGIAHEINTPIQYVGDNVRFLEDSFSSLMQVLDVWKNVISAAQEVMPKLPQVREAVEVAERIELDFICSEIPNAIAQSAEGIDRVASIVRAMKEFSHPDRKNKVSTDINKCIATTITVARNEWKYVAEVVTDLDENLPAVTCIPGDFNQVILNLIVNAAHAIDDRLRPNSPAKGEILISTKSVDSQVEIRVSDTGTGIPEAIRSQIFDPFFTTKEVGKGTGQGLAIAYAVVVTKHGGTIHCESEVGVGTTFVIRMPISCAENYDEENCSDAASPLR